jgi:hypothetical protein
VRIRLEATRFWQAKLSELEGEERKLHATLDAGVEAIIGPKRVLLFKAMMDAACNDDAILIYDLCHGFPIIGTAPVSGNFEQRTAAGARCLRRDAG